jgi:hypothetical protein
MLAAVMLALTVLIALGAGIVAAYACINTILHLFAARKTSPVLEPHLAVKSTQLAGD